MYIVKQTNYVANGWWAFYAVRISSFFANSSFGAAIVAAAGVAIVVHIWRCNSLIDIINFNIKLTDEINIPCQQLFKQNPCNKQGISCQPIHGTFWCQLCVNNIASYRFAQIVFAVYERSMFGQKLYWWHTTVGLCPLRAAARPWTHFQWPSLTTRGADK